MTDESGKDRHGRSTDADKEVNVDGGMMANDEVKATMVVVGSANGRINQSPDG